MKKILNSLVYLVSFTTLISSQAVDFCGRFPFHKALSNNLDSIYYDRFGNTYDRNSSPSPVGAEHCIVGGGDFDLCFINAPQDYQNTVCLVFEELSNLIQRRTNFFGCTPQEPIPNQQLIVVNVEMVSTFDYGAAASPYYFPDQFHCPYNLNPSIPYTIINGGFEYFYSFDPDAKLKISDVWNWNFSYNTNPTNAQVDCMSSGQSALKHLLFKVVFIKVS